MIVLHRVEPERHLCRWYTVHVQPTLFERWAVICAWGSLRSNFCQERAIPCENEEAALDLAAKVVARKERRGYERKEQK